MALYLKSDLCGKLALQYSNGTVEALIVKVKKLDTIFITIYRPPNTQTEDWNDAVELIENEIDLIQANGSFGSVIMSGDFNFPSLEWYQNRPKIEITLSKQQEKFVGMINKLCLFNYVDKPTCGNNILDLCLTNDTELFTKVRTDENSKFSDHRLIICEFNQNVIENASENDLDVIKYMTNVPLYSWKNGSVDQ